MTPELKSEIELLGHVADREFEILKGVPELLQECSQRICTPDPCMQNIYQKIVTLRRDIEELI